MDDSLDNLPILDWGLAQKLAGNRLDVAKELFAMLTQDLSQDVDAILALAKERNYTELCRAIHRLHGAVAYCGAPRLKRMLLLLETNCKKHAFDNLSTLLHQLYSEANSVLRAAAHS